MGTTKADFLAAACAKPIKVSVPELGGKGRHVYIKRLSIRQREEWEVWCHDADEKGIGAAIKRTGGFRAIFLAKVLCDDSGKLLFPNEKEAIEILGEFDGVAVARLHNEALDHNGLNPDSQEDFEGNSKAAPSVGTSLG